MHPETQTLIADVQHNCHIADARHGTDFGLCTYLMKMREYCRWEKGLGYTDALDKDLVGDWLTAREDLWDRVCDEDYRPLFLAGQQYEPFDAEAINQCLAAQGLLYSAGLVQSGKAQFFVTELLEHRVDDDGFELWVGGRELARGLQAPPAMTQGRHIFLRREALRQLLWERYESWLWSKPDNAFKRALSSYPFDADIVLALDQMTEAEMAVIRAHEVGEYRVGLQLGPAWEDLLLATLGTPAELMLRAVRDHWADCLETLPYLLRAEPEASLHAFIGNQSNMRKAIFPSLSTAYQHWLDTQHAGRLWAIAESGAAHWQAVAEQALAAFRQQPDAIAMRIVKLVDAAHR